MSCDGKWKELQSRETSHRKTETKHIYVFIEIKELYFRSSFSKDLQKIQQMRSKDKLLNVFLFFCCFVVWNNVHKKNKPVNKKLKVRKCADVNLVFCCPLVITSYKCELETSRVETSAKTRQAVSSAICSNLFVCFFLCFFFLLKKKHEMQCNVLGRHEGCWWVHGGRGVVGENVINM